MKKVLLLDFDGVVLKNKLADAAVAKRAGVYTWKACTKIPRSPNEIGIKHANELCYGVYKGYGHTVTGLKAVGIDCNLAEYNHLVYSTIDYAKLRQVNNNLDDLRSLLKYCKDEHILTYIFSNAPEQWIQGMLKNDADLLEALNDVRGVIGVNKNDETFLKPKKEVYDAIDARLNGDKIYFVDDNMVNFTHSLKRPNWINIYCSDFNKKIKNNMYIANGIHGVMDIV